MFDIRCGKCKKKLAYGEYIKLEIKCPRCGAFNHLKASEPPTKSAQSAIVIGGAHVAAHHSLDRRQA